MKKTFPRRYYPIWNAGSSFTAVRRKTRSSARQLPDRSRGSVQLLHLIVDVRRETEAFGVAGSRHGQADAMLLVQRVVNLLGGLSRDLELHDAARELRLQIRFELHARNLAQLLLHMSGQD